MGANDEPGEGRHKFRENYDEFAPVLFFKPKAAIRPIAYFH
jgi:hypothetical protein